MNVDDTDSSRQSPAPKTPNPVAAAVAALGAIVTCIALVTFGVWPQHRDTVEAALTLLGWILEVTRFVVAVRTGNTRP